MKFYFQIILVFVICIGVFLFLVEAQPNQLYNYNKREPIIFEESEINLTIREGYLSSKKETIKLNRDSITIGTINISEPLMIAMAEQPERWGFFQFPFITKTDDNNMYISWQMAEDSHKSIGVRSNRKPLPMVSEDGGRTWMPKEVTSFGLSGNIHGIMRNGSILQIMIPKPREIESYSEFPKSVGKLDDYTFYRIEELPDDCQGVYLTLWDKNRRSRIIHAKVYDPDALRYSVDGVMPIIWSGTIRQLSDSSLVAGVYPAYYEEKGAITPCGISFYKSTDNGLSWKIHGKIPFPKNAVKGNIGANGFDEVAFEVLADSTFITVMRTGSASPMYSSFSYNKGRTWSIPKPITPNGVKPKLLLLGNGVLTLVSGRPGVQIRFSFDGSGQVWSEPIDMIPFMDKSGDYIQEVSCGYGSILQADENSFYIVYSDFTTKNQDGEIRKSIWFRKVSFHKNTLN